MASRTGSYVQTLNLNTIRVSVKDNPDTHRFIYINENGEFYTDPFNSLDLTYIPICQGFLSVSAAIPTKSRTYYPCIPIGFDGIVGTNSTVTISDGTIINSIISSNKIILTFQTGVSTFPHLILQIYNGNNNDFSISTLNISLNLYKIIPVNWIGVIPNTQGTQYTGLILKFTNILVTGNTPIIILANIGEQPKNYTITTDGNLQFDWLAPMTNTVIFTFNNLYDGLSYSNGTTFTIILDSDNPFSQWIQQIYQQVKIIRILVQIN